MRVTKNINRDMATGEIEVLASSLTIINRADVLPLDSNHVNTEEARLKYRYLDLRRPEMAQRLKTRAKITSLVRRFMDDHGFLDIETPMLTKATPEGAQTTWCLLVCTKVNSTHCRNPRSCSNSC